MPKRATSFPLDYYSLQVAVEWFLDELLPCDYPDDQYQQVVDKVVDALAFLTVKNGQAYYD